VYSTARFMLNIFSYACYNILFELNLLGSINTDGTQKNSQF